MLAYYQGNIFRNTKSELHLVFVDLEKAYDRVPRKLIEYALRERGVPEQYVSVVKDMYEETETVISVASGSSRSFKVDVGVHKGPVVSPLLFIIALNVLTEDTKETQR